VAWLAVHTSRTAVGQLMRIAWRTVGAICARVARDGAAGADRLAGLRRIGIDELSYKRGHRYITCVVDHDTGRLVWAAPGRDKATLGGFFDLLGAAGPGQVVDVEAAHAAQIERVLIPRIEQVPVQPLAAARRPVVVDHEREPVRDSMPVEHRRNPLGAHTDRPGHAQPAAGEHPPVHLNHPHKGPLGSAEGTPRKPVRQHPGRRYRMVCM
jgi:Transposase